MLVLASMLLFAGDATAQTRISGRVLDAEGQPVPGLEVLLHAITEASGTEVDKDTSRTDGAFDVTVTDVDSDAVYFVAVVYNGQLFMGDLLRPPFPLEQEYVVRVGVNPVDLSAEAAGTAVTPEQAESERTAGVMVVLVAAGVIGAILFFVLRRRPPAQRRWLVELARLEEELATHPDAGEALEARRAELRDRLKGRASD
jgi:hypothetical protein